MPLILWIGSLLGALFTGLVQFFAQHLTKRFVIIGFVVAAITAFTVAFFLAVSSIMSALVGSTPAPVETAISMFVPSNAYACIAAVFTAHTLRWVYEWNIKIVQFRL
jgi:hypothetical protein